jgi:hypothetical protein
MYWPSLPPLTDRQCDTLGLVAAQTPLTPARRPGLVTDDVRSAPDGPGRTVGSQCLGGFVTLLQIAKLKP